MIQITVQVNHIIFRKSSEFGDCWYILATDQGKCQGVIKWEPVQGERLELSGEWAVYKGEKEFKFTSVRPELPEDSRTLLHYVCERTAGIGPKMEQKIWDTLKEDWKDLAFGDVPRMQEEVCDEFLRQYRDILLHDEQFKAIAFLISKGCTPKMAEAAFDEWNTAAVGIVNNNCFRLTELTGYGFHHVDKDIRDNYKISLTDARRIKAGITYAIKQAQADGSTVIEVDSMLGASLELLKVKEQLIFDIAAEMLNEGEIVGFESSGRIAGRSDYKNEAIIWNFGGREA